MTAAIAELLKPSEGAAIEFWCRRMSQQGLPGAGIPGWFRSGLFWSHDNADHYAPGEVTHWMLRSSSMARQPLQVTPSRPSQLLG